ncbi:MAG TPA: RICIN domain-containing protein [Acidimicrobiales bacterium]|nr:RICIN domain-containing protein [Acidimicrobiales bacterium]
MAGDLHVDEWAVLEGEEEPAARAGAAPGEARAIHRFGRVRVMAGPEQPGRAVPGAPDLAGLADVTETERLGLAALALRGSDDYQAAKAQRPRQGEVWDLRSCTEVGEVPPDARRIPPTGRRGPLAAPAPVGAPFRPTSDYLEGSVAVGIVIVEGPDAALKFPDAERLKIIAEVQNGLGWYAATNPLAGITFVYDIHVVTLGVPPDPAAPDLEAHWRDPAMGALGYDPSWDGVYDYVEGLRTGFGTRWAFCGFFTKYPLWWFAYASLGGPRLVMDYAVDGWGTENMDRVFAHETGHIFNCPDEYGSSGCDCGGWWGRFRLPNGNCENCAAGGGVPCLMRANDFLLCEYTQGHLGWQVTTPLRARHSGKVLDVEGAATTSGARVQQWDANGGAHQRWRLEALGDESVRAVATHSGKVLDVRAVSTADGAVIQQWDWTGGDNQRWRLDNIDYAGELRLTARHSGKALDVEGSSAANGATAVQRTWIRRHSQRWSYGYRPLLAKHSGRAMSSTQVSYEEGAPVVQCEYFAGDGQLWWLFPRPGGYVVVSSRESGLVLDVEGFSTGNGARIILWWETGGDNQLFLPEPVEPGFVRLVAKHSGKVIDVTGVSTADGAPLHQWDWTGGDNQRWRV